MQQKHRRVLGVTGAAFVGALLLTPATAFAQWEKVKPLNLPRKTDGKPNLTAPAPRRPDGKPDLSGIWWLSTARSTETAPPRYLENIAADLKPDEVPFQPWAAALYKQRKENFSKDVPYTHCLPAGVPMIASFTAPWKLIQNPDLITILYETSSTYRQIFMDGRVLSKDANPTWMGYSTGRWEGDTLVVETSGFNDKTWLDFFGHPHTDAFRLTERIRRRDIGHLDIEYTFDDPKAYTKPWKVTIHPILQLEGDLFEFVCNENEKDIEHMAK